MRIPVRKRVKAALGRMGERAGIYARTFRSKMLIIAFHRVTDEMAEDGLTCSSEKFENFCRFFVANFRIVPLSEQVAGCRNGRDMGGTLSITFDDGYRDNFDVAAPILRRLQLPATFFLTTGFIGTEHLAPWDVHLARRPAWMDWDQVRLLHQQGFEIGAHTVSHIDLGKESPEAIRAELDACRTRLQRELEAPVSLFAYPFGGRDNISTVSRGLVRETGFDCCLSCFGGVNSAVADPFDLNRINIGEWFSTPHQFGFEVVVGKV